MFMILSNISPTNNMCFMMFSVSVQDQLSTLLSLFLIQNIMFLVLPCCHQLPDDLEAQTSVESIRSLKSLCFISWSLLPLQCSKQKFGGGHFLVYSSILSAYIVCFVSMKKCLMFFFFWPATKKQQNTHAHTLKKEKKTLEVLRWLSRHGDAFAPQWSHVLRVTQLATLPTSGASIADAMIQPLPPLLTQMIEAWLLITDENEVWNVYRVAFEGMSILVSDMFRISSNRLNLLGANNSGGASPFVFFQPFLTTAFFFDRNWNPLAEQERTVRCAGWKHGWMKQIHSKWSFFWTPADIKQVILSKWGEWK